MIKHFSFIEAGDFSVIKNKLNPFNYMPHEAIVIEFNKKSPDRSDNELLHYFHEITYDIAHAAVRFNGMLLASIHPVLYTKEMCVDAMISRPESVLLSLQNKDLFNDDEFIKTCIHRYPECISALGDRLTDELIETAVLLKPPVISFVDNPSKELCMLAIQKDPFSIEYINKCTMEMYVTALTANPGCSVFIPDKIMSNIVDSLTSDAKMALLLSYIGTRREDGSSLQADKLKFIKKEWRAVNIHCTKP